MRGSSSARQMGMITLAAILVGGALARVPANAEEMSAGVATAGWDLQGLLSAARKGERGIRSLAGFETFWYIWASTNQETQLLE